MDQEQSVTQLIRRVVQGEQGMVQEELVQRFLERLTALARTRLRSVRGYEDEADVALSAMNSFLVRAPKQDLGPLGDRHALWSLLAAITIRKSITVRRRMFAQKRDVRRSRSLQDLLVEPPTHQFLDSVFEEGNRLLDSLQDPILRQIALLRLEGYSNEEVAARIGRSIKTVERKLQLIRRRLQAELDGVDG
jgi:DNA-directed RNA polymerase specialized sigma24 family protein